MSISSSGSKPLAARNLFGQDFLVSFDDISSVLPTNTGIRLKGFDGYPLVNIEIADRAVRQRVLRHIVNLVQRRDRNIPISDEELDISHFFPAVEDDVESAE